MSIDWFSPTVGARLSPSLLHLLALCADYGKGRKRDAYKKGRQGMWVNTPLGNCTNVSSCTCQNTSVRTVASAVVVLLCHLGFLGEVWWLMGYWFCKHWLISTCTAVVSLFLAWACSLRSKEGVACVNKMAKPNQRASGKQLWNCYIHQEVCTIKHTIWCWQDRWPQQQKVEMGEHRRSEKKWILLRSWDCREEKGEDVGKIRNWESETKCWRRGGKQRMVQSWKSTGDGKAELLQGKGGDTVHGRRVCGRI